jgi:preprotein translocase subunit SecE
MNAKADSNPINVSSMTGADYAFLIVAALLIGAGIFVYHHFDGAWAGWQRTLAMLGALGGGLTVAILSSPGKSFLKFLDASLLELRKVVWPTKQETTQTTIVVGIAVLIVGILLFIIDFLLAQMVKYTMG